MVDAVRHTLRFQDQRTSKNLNAHTKDLFGRHRGHVLYGMQATITGLNTIRINAGAIYTPLGTHFYWDVYSSPAVATINLAAALNLATLAAAERPAVVALIAQVSLASPSTPFALESVAQISAQTIQFSARVVSVSRATGQPTLSLNPLSPVDLNVSQPLTGGTHYVHTWDATEPSGAAVQAPVATTAELGSLQNNEVLLGYIVVGSPEADAGGASALPTTYGVGAGPYTWAPGIAYVPALNPHEAVADLLGLDPMLGRVADRVVSGRAPGGAGNRGLTQTTTADRIGSGGTVSDAGFAETAPKFGSTAPTASATSPWASTWATYRWPSFLRDGDSFLMALKRMDYVLRLWMNRTGDQKLVQLTQDTRIDNEATAGPLNYQATLAQLLRHFDGTKVAASGISKNSNTMGWGTVAVPVVDATANGHVLVDGVVTHDPATAGAGDSHFSAIQGLDSAVFHILRDVIGFGATNRAFPTKADLRDDSTAIDAGVRTHFADGPVNFQNQLTNTTVAAARGTAAGAAVLPYLTTESLYDAVAKLAHRTMHGPSENMLIDANFALTSDNTVLSWQLGGGASIAGKSNVNDGANGLELAIDGTGAGHLQQLIFVRPSADANGNNAFAGQLRSFCGIIMPIAGTATASTATVSIEFTTAGGTLVTGSSVSQVIALTAAIEPIPFSISGICDSGAAVGMRVRVAFNTPGAATVRVYGTWAGTGTPPAPTTNRRAYEYLSRQGGSYAAMRGPLHLAPTNTLTAPIAPRADQSLTTTGIVPATDYNAAGRKITNGAPGVAGTDFVLMNQVSALTNPRMFAAKQHGASLGFPGTLQDMNPLRGLIILARGAAGGGGGVGGCGSSCIAGGHGGDGGVGGRAILVITGLNGITVDVEVTNEPTGGAFGTSYGYSNTWGDNGANGEECTITVTLTLPNTDVVSVVVNAGYGGGGGGGRTGFSSGAGTTGAGGQSSSIAWYLNGVLQATQSVAGSAGQAGGGGAGEAGARRGGPGGAGGLVSAVLNVNSGTPFFSYPAFETAAMAMFAGAPAFGQRNFDTTAAGAAGQGGTNTDDCCAYANATPGGDGSLYDYWF